MEKTFSFINYKGILVNREFYELLIESAFLDRLRDFERLEEFFPLIFSHRKYYRKVFAFRVKDKKIYLKRYFQNLKEAESEWKNIQLLWKNEIPTSIPILFFIEGKTALIGTEEIPGRRYPELMKEVGDKKENFICKIANFLKKFHEKGFFHQDCYLNHFFYEKDSDIIYLIDVSRVLYRPFLSFYYRVKDLAQLAFSFETYLKEEANFLWDVFWRNYIYKDFKNKDFKNKKILRSLVEIKRGLIRRRTIKKLCSK